MRETSLWRDRRSAVAIVIASAAIPMIGLVGIAIDFGIYNEARSQLDMAAQNAALQAARMASRAFIDTRTDYLAEGENVGEAWFLAQAGSLPYGARLSSSSVTMPALNNASTFYATATYSASVPRVFGQLFNAGPWPVSGTANAQITLNAYTDVDMVLDNSGSMFIPEDQTGMEALALMTETAYLPSAVTTSANNTGGGQFQCALACHWVAASGGVSTDFYGIAEGEWPTDSPSSHGYASGKIPLRTNIITNAAATAISDMETAEQSVGISNLFATNMFTFNTTTSQQFPNSSSSTAACQGNATNPADADLTDAATCISGLVPPVGLNVANGVPGMTNFNDSSTGPMAQMINTFGLTASGTGLTRATARKNLFVVTDGVEDYQLNGNRTLGTFDATQCNLFKNLGYTVYVLYTEYYPFDSQVSPYSIYYNSWYTGSSGLVPKVEQPSMTTSPVVTSLQSCASDTSDFFIATSTSSINNAMQQMLKSALDAPARLY